MGTISWIAVIVAAVAKFFIGFAWYSPPLFAKQWQRLAGVTPEQVQAGLAPALVAEAIGDLLMAFALAWVIGYVGATGFGGILVGILAWLGFVAPVLANQVFYERKPMQLILINASYVLVSLVVMGAILSLWRG